MATLDDFYGDGSADNTPECSFCGGQDGKLIVSVSDHYGPTHWHHKACKAKDDAKTGAALTPTWDEAMDGGPSAKRNACDTHVKTTAVQTLQDQDVIMTDGYIPFEECVSPELYDAMEIQDEISSQVYDANTGITEVCRSSISAFYYKDGQFVAFAAHADRYQVNGCHSPDILQALLTI